jgi:hypothetical protein
MHYLRSKLVQEKRKSTPSAHGWRRLKWGHFYRQRELVFWKEQLKQQAQLTDEIMTGIQEDIISKTKGTTGKENADRLVWIEFHFTGAAKLGLRTRGKIALNDFQEEPSFLKKMLCGCMGKPPNFQYAVRFRVFRRCNEQGRFGPYESTQSKSRKRAWLDPDTAIDPATGKRLDTPAGEEPVENPWPVMWEAMSKPRKQPWGTDGGWHKEADMLRLPVPFFESMAAEFKWAAQLVQVECEPIDNFESNIVRVIKVLGQFIGDLSDSANKPSYVSTDSDSDESNSLKPGLGLKIMLEENKGLVLTKNTPLANAEWVNPMAPWDGEKKSKLRKQGRRMSINMRSKQTGEQILCKTNDSSRFMTKTLCKLNDLKKHFLSGKSKCHGAKVNDDVRKSCLDVYTTALYMQERKFLQNEGGSMLKQELKYTDWLEVMSEWTEMSRAGSVCPQRFDTVGPTETYGCVPEILYNQKARICRELGGDNEEGLELFECHTDGRSTASTLRGGLPLGEIEAREIFQNWFLWRKYYRDHLLGSARGGDEVTCRYEEEKIPAKIQVDGSMLRKLDGVYHLRPEAHEGRPCYTCTAGDESQHHLYHIPSQGRWYISVQLGQRSSKKGGAMVESLVKLPTEIIGLWRAIPKKYKVGDEVRRSQFAGGYKVGKVVAANKDDSYNLDYGEGVRQEDRLEEGIAVEDLKAMKVKKAGNITISPIGKDATLRYKWAGMWMPPGKSADVETTPSVWRQGQDALLMCRVCAFLTPSPPPPPHALSHALPYAPLSRAPTHALSRSRWCSSRVQPQAVD